MDKEQLYTGYPNIGDTKEFYSYIEDIFNRRWLTNNGKYVKQLEKDLCDYLGVKHAIPVCNGTIGLEVAAKTLGFSGEVILPSFTFAATAHMLKWQGIEPIFADIDKNTLTIDCNHVESLITHKTSGIVGVHLWGIPCEIEKLERTAQDHNIKLLFDAAHAFGCRYKDSMIGNFGNCEVFSFHATKIFNTFEGGAITTNDDELADKIRLAINFGFSGEDYVMSLGINGKMNEICAAMGIVNLKQIKEFIQRSKARYQLYRTGLSNISGIKLIEYEKEGVLNNFHYIPIIVEEKRYGESRDELKLRLSKHNIIARRYFYPGCHRLEPYADKYGALPLHNTNYTAERVLILPNGDNISHDSIEKICEILKEGKKVIS